MFVCPQAKKLNRSLKRVGLTVSLKGIRMVETEAGTVLMDYSIYRCSWSRPWATAILPRISYCSADATLSFCRSSRSVASVCVCDVRRLRRRGTSSASLKIWGACIDAESNCGVGESAA